MRNEEHVHAVHSKVNFANLNACWRWSGHKKSPQLPVNSVVDLRKPKQTDSRGSGRGTRTRREEEKKRKRRKAVVVSVSWLLLVSANQQSRCAAIPGPPQSRRRVRFLFFSSSSLLSFFLPGSAVVASARLIFSFFFNSVVSFLLFYYSCHLQQSVLVSCQQQLLRYCHLVFSLKRDYCCCLHSSKVFHFACAVYLVSRSYFQFIE